MARHPEERGPLLLVVSLLIVGTVCYLLVEGFTVVYVLCGIGILVSFFTALASKTLELQAERRRRPASSSEQLEPRRGQRGLGHEPPPRHPPAEQHVRRYESEGEHARERER
jgi:hypothetical protein